MCLHGVSSLAWYQKMPNNPVTIWMNESCLINTNDTRVDHCPVSVRQHTFSCNLHSRGTNERGDGGKVGQSRGLCFVLPDQLSDGSPYMW